MSEALIESAIKARLAGGGLAWNIAWPNQDVPAPAPLPRIEVNIARVSNRSLSTIQLPRQSIGLVRVLVIVKRGTSTATANSKADEVAALMQKGERVTYANGQAIFTDNADIREGFSSGAEWVVPVIGKYEGLTHV